MSSVGSCSSTAHSSAATFCSASSSSLSTSGTIPSETISAEPSSLASTAVSLLSSVVSASSSSAQSQAATTSFDFTTPVSPSSFAAIESEVSPSSVIAGNMSSFSPTAYTESSKPRESEPASPSAAISEPQESSIVIASSSTASVQAISSVSEDSPSPSSSLSPEPSSSDVPSPSPPPSTSTSSSSISSSQGPGPNTSNDPGPATSTSASPTTNASKEKESTQASQGSNNASSSSTDGTPPTVAITSGTQTPNSPSPQTTADGQRSAEPSPVTTLNVSAPIFQQPTAGVHVSTAPDGSIPTQSSTPTSVSGATSSSFFDNKGAVAGTFTAIGLVVVALAVMLAVCRRRRLRRDRRINWIHGFQRPSSPIPIQEEDPFRDSYSPPPMRQRSPTADGGPQRPARTQANLYKNISTPAVPGTIHGPAIGASVGAGGMGGAVYSNTAQPSAIAYGNPFDDKNSPTNAAYGLATTGSVSSGRTTPSVYSGISGPDKDVDVDEEAFYLDPDLHSSEASYPHGEPIASPPRTYTQGKVVRVGSEWRPISPPTTLESYTESRPQSLVRSASTSSGHNHNINNLKIQTSPRLSPSMVLQRKTLLNVRHKPGSSEDSGVDGYPGWTKV